MRARTPEAPDKWANYERPRIRSRAEAREKYWGEHDRDGFECRRCGDTSSRIDVHHIDGDPFNNDIDNLVGLCYRCHRQVHRRKATERRITEMKREAEEMGN